MAAAFTRRTLALKANTLQHLARAVQNAYGQTTAQFEATLGITQVNYGTFTFAGTPTATVTFNAPFPDANYALIMSPPMVPNSIIKTATSFSVTIVDLIPGIPIDWIAVR